MPYLRPFTRIRRCSLLYALPASHGENRGSSPLGSANGIKDLFQNRQLVSNNCPINGYGQAWASMIENRAHACARHEFPSAPRYSVVVNAAASAGSHRQAIERLPKDCRASGARTDIRRSPAPKFQSSTSAIAVAPTGRMTACDHRSRLTKGR